MNIKIPLVIKVCDLLFSKYYEDKVHQTKIRKELSISFTYITILIKKMEDFGLVTTKRVNIYSYVYINKKHIEFFKACSVIMKYLGGKNEIKNK